MRIEQLYYFVEVVKEESISKAAKKIFVTQQSISQSISNLEKELGVSLLIRGPKRIYLTPAGEIFYERTQKVLAAFGELKTCFLPDNMLKDKKANVRGQLTIYCSMLLSKMGIQKLVTEFQEEYPDIEIRIFEIGAQNPFPFIDQPNTVAIISILNGYFVEEIKNKIKKNFWCETLYKDRMVACVSAKSPLVEKNVISLEEWLTYPLAMTIGCAFDHKALEIAAHKKLPNPDIVLVTSDNMWIKDWVSTGNAVTCLAENLIHTAPWNMENEIRDSICIIPFKEDLDLAYILVRQLSEENDNIVYNLFTEKLRKFFSIQLL